MINENTCQNLFQLGNTGRSKVQIAKDGKINIYVSFRKIDGLYELKLMVKIADFEAVHVSKVEVELVYERRALI